VLNKIKLILSNKSVVKKIGFTIIILLALRIFAYFVKIPLYADEGLNAWVTNNSFLAFLNSFGGQALEQTSIIALGISPYITASILTQLLEIVLPQIKAWREEGEAGKLKISRLTRYMGIALAFIQGLLLIAGSNSQNSVNFGIDNPNIGHYMYMALTITAGTAICIWFADLITKKGIGNGSSMLICAGVVVSIPDMFVSIHTKFITAGNGGWDIFWFIFIILVYFAVIAAMTYIQISVRKIPVQYANRQGKSDSNIPLRINASGVMPVIFASTLLAIPLSISGFMNLSATSGSGYWMDQFFNNQKIIGFILYVVLIIVFSFFYTFMTVNPEKISDNLQKSHAFIPGVRPGEDTQNYIARLLFKVTVIGTLYLVIIASMPIIINIIFDLGNGIAIGGTSLLIVVGVAIETGNQIDAEVSNNEYQEFI